MSYVYKNESDRPINIGGYQFAKGQELPSSIKINGFNEAVSNGFLSLKVVTSSKDTDIATCEKSKEHPEFSKPSKIAAERAKEEDAKFKAEAEMQRIANEEAKKVVEPV